MKIARKLVSMCLAMALFVTMFTANTMDVHAAETVILTVDDYDYGSQLNLSFAVSKEDSSQSDYVIKWFYNDTAADYDEYISCTETYICTFQMEVSDCLGGKVSGDVTVVAKAYKDDVEVAVSNEVVIGVAENKLNPVQNIRLEGSTLMWDAVEGATNYQVQLSKKTGETSYQVIQDESLRKVEGTSVDISAHVNEVARIKVRALSDDCANYLHSDFTGISVDGNNGAASTSNSTEADNKTETVAEENGSSDAKEVNPAETAKEKVDNDKPKKGFLAGLLSIFSLSGCGHEHTWTEATCEVPKTCSECGETEGEMLEHVWVEATYTEPKTCSVCNITEGTSLPVCVAKIGADTYEEYEYDANGNKIATNYYIISAQNYEYDANGNLVGENKGDTYRYEYQYDDKDNLIKHTSYEDGRVYYERNYVYDDSNKLIMEESYETFSSGNVYKAYEAYYEYNAEELLVKETWTDYQMGIWTGETTYEYDNEGRRTLEHASSVYEGKRSESTIEYVYDTAGNGYSTNEIVSGMIYRTIEYDQNGKVINEKNLAEETEIVYEYDENHNVKKEITNEKDGSQSVSEYDNEYDANGNLLSTVMKRCYDTVKFEYDTNGKLIREISYDGMEIVYENDAYGNPILVSKSGGYLVGTSTQEFQYEYDAEGKMTAKIKSDDGTKTIYEYDTNGNLVKESNGDSQTITYEYDANGNKVSSRAEGIFKVKLNGEDFSSGYLNEYSYEYDENGNMIRETMVPYEDGEMGNSYVYEYTYAPLK